MKLSSNIHEYYLLVFFINSMNLPLLFSSLIIPLLSLLYPHLISAPLLLCYFSCLPFPASLPSVPPPQLIRSIISPVDIHILPRTLPFSFPPTPPLPPLLSLSGPCVTLLLLSRCSCGPSPIINHFCCDFDHFCRCHYVQRLKNEGGGRKGRKERCVEEQQE